MDPAAGDAPDFWLEGGVIPLRGGAEAGFIAEVDRVVELLSEDRSWLRWWRGASKAPVLELQMFLLRHPRSPESESSLVYARADEQVVKGRRRHLVRIHVDSDELEELEPDERRLRALPHVLHGISRATNYLKITDPPPSVPAEAQPAPLPPGVLRRRRLKQLLAARDTPSP